METRGATTVLIKVYTANDGRISWAWNGRVRRERVRASGRVGWTNGRGAKKGSRIFQRLSIMACYRAGSINMRASSKQSGDIYRLVGLTSIK